jgi:DNA-binding IclR family transcriptional regulator
VETRRFGSLTAGLDILERLARSPEGVSVTDLARYVELDKGHAHRLLRELERRGYVEQDASSKLFHATVQFVSLASLILRNLDLVSAASPILRQLQDSTGEAVHLARRVRAGGVYVAQERPVARISVETEIGSQPVLHCTATGKALFAFADDELRSLLTEPFQQYTHRTLTTFEELARELAATRERGYAVDDEELSPEVRCVAAPVFDMMANVVGCIGLSGPISRVTLDRLPELGAVVLAAAQDVSSKIGGHAPGNFAVASRSSTETARSIEADGDPSTAGSPGVHRSRPQVPVTGA